MSVWSTSTKTSIAAKRNLEARARADADEPNLFMVGDVKQSIYRFRWPIRPCSGPSRALQPFAEAVRQGGLFTGRGRASSICGPTSSRRQIVDGGTSSSANPPARRGRTGIRRTAELVAHAAYPPAEETGIELHLVERINAPARRGSREHERSEDGGAVDEQREDEFSAELLTALEREAARSPG